MSVPRDSILQSGQWQCSGCRTFNPASQEGCSMIMIPLQHSENPGKPEPVLPAVPQQPVASAPPPSTNTTDTIDRAVVVVVADNIVGNGDADDTTAAGTTQPPVESKENSPKEYIMKVTYTQKEGRMILTTTSKSGAYERYIAAEWGESKDGAFEQELEKKFNECKEWMEQKPESGKTKKMIVSEGDRSSATTRGAAASAPIQSKSAAGQNCIAAAAANGIDALLALSPAEKAAMQVKIWDTESERSDNRLKKCGGIVRDLNWHVAVQYPKTFVKEQGLVSVEWMPFFRSSVPASFGVFLIKIDSHVICLVRQSKDDNSLNYIVDGNPKFGACRHPYTEDSFKLLEVGKIDFAVKMVLQ